MLPDAFLEIERQHVAFASQYLGAGDTGHTDLAPVPAEDLYLATRVVELRTGNAVDEPCRW